MVLSQFRNKPSILKWRHNERNGVSNDQPHDVYSTVHSGADQRKHQPPASLAFVRGIHRDRQIPLKKGPARKSFIFIL